MLTYAEVIATNPSYSARRYATRLPYAIVAPGLAGLALILCFFFLPWFSTGDTTASTSITAFKGPMNVSAITVGTSSIDHTQTVANPDGTNQRRISDSYSFPLIWAFLVIGLIQIVLALLVLKDRLLPKILVLAIRISFAVALALELIYFWSSFFLAYSKIKSPGGQIATYPALGFWLSFLVTIVTAFMAVVILPDLKWCFSLATNDAARAVRMGELRANKSERDLASEARDA